MSEVKECVTYFKQNRNAYHRALAEMRAKWKKYGRATGKIVLKNASPEERTTLGGFLGIAFSGENLSFSVQSFARALSETKFSQVSLEELLSNYFDEKLSTNQEDRTARKEAIRSYQQTIEENLTDSEVKQWFAEMESHRFQHYRSLLSDDIQFETCLLNCENAYKIIRKRKNVIRLSVLSMDCFGNPHALDAVQSEGKLFFHLLLNIFKKSKNELLEGKMNSSLNAEQKQEVYLFFGIRTDDISSFTCMQGFHLYEGNELHPAYEGHCMKKESYLVSLSQLDKITAIQPVNRHVYVIENQMVYSEITQKCPEASLICTSGQVKIASLVVLDLLCQQDCSIHYSGDIDPEGMVIADKLIRRGKGKIQAWRMSADDYLESQSSVKISESRQSELSAIQDEMLQDTAKLISQYKIAGYQEKLMERMIEDIRTQTLNHNSVQEDV